MSPRTRLLPALAALATAALLAGCSSSDPGPDPGGDVPGADAPISRGIDARKYAEDYEGAMYDSAAVAGTAAGTAVGAAGSGNVGGPVPAPPLRGPSASYASAPPTVEVPGGGGFVDAGTSDFVDTADDALSTFALDVDTGSFGVARALLRQGVDVPPASIRPEEWVNALPSSDPAPTDADLGLSTESGLAPTLDDGTQLVRVGVQAREVSAADRPPLHVTLVVDRSGSMDAPDRLGLVQSSLALLADRLRDDDTVSVVSFESRAKPVLEPTKVADTDAIVDAIDKLTPAGSTNLEAGLRLGYEEARKTFEDGATNVVVLASDGGANVGRTGPGSIVDTIQHEGADGIHLLTVGYGTDGYNDRLMEQLADLGNGFYSYVDNYDDAEAFFGSAISTELVPVADDAKAQVSFDPAVVASYRQIGYENRAAADDFTKDVDAGELGAGHHATALYEVRLVDGVDPGAVIGTASLRWTSVDGAAEQASADLVAADPSSTTLPDSLALPAVAADLAQQLKHAEPFDGRTNLSAIEARAQALDDAGVEGAAQLVTMAHQASRRSR